ncbi:hypothetical protein L210DRAFT_3644826 [Boletus edulis BED1]|uniref:Heterokaryon incompatibility domain-containing protein n=1 Tax=Boletus edulis BED1 TaxID=1328754 RepID=A0AAD4BVW3_BOLED|nr:hypothetical protein L210DRAFT_3644826 [Boletus edulis BED1]
MGQLLSVLLAHPLPDLTSETPKDEVPTTPATDSEAKHTLPKPTAPEPPLQAPSLPELKKPLGHQWRLIDARAFIHNGTIRLVRIDDFRDMDVIAISYTWSEDMKRWRERIIQMGSGRTYEDKILRGSASVSHALAGGSFSMNDVDQASLTRAHLFFTMVAFMVFTRGKKFFWMDILCINQEKIEEKKFFVPRMGTLYNDTYETHAYPSGAEIAPSVMHESVQKPVWETRAWTAQEHILAKRVIFCYLFQGDVVDDIRGVSESPDDEAVVNRQLDSSPVLDQFRYSRGIYVLRRGEHIMTCHMETEEPFGNFATSAMSKFIPGTSGVQWDMVREVASRSTMYKQIALIRKSGGPLVQARLCLQMLPMRKSTCPEDMIYSALGTFNMEDFIPEYGIGFEEARLRVFEAMKPSVLAHLLGTDWRSNQGNVHRDTALPRIVGGVPTVGATYLQSSILDCKYDRTTGTKLRCRAEKWRIWRPTMDVRSMTGVTRCVLANNRLIIVQGSRTDCDQRSLAQPSTSSEIPLTSSQSECVRNIVIHSSSIGISDEEYFKGTRHFEQLVEFIEVGSCHNVELIMPVRNTAISLMALCTDQLASGNYRNMGAALIADLDAFTSEFVDVVIE